jgi:hypothetical protein
MFDKPSRNYDALQFTVSRRFSKALYMQGSYTYSRTKGNYPGLISYDNGQIDPNISSQYDLIELLSATARAAQPGPPHYIKLDGYYKFDLKKAGEITIGTRLRALSGVPRQAQAGHWLYGPGESFLLPRGRSAAPSSRRHRPPRRLRQEARQGQHGARGVRRPVQPGQRPGRRRRRRHLLDPVVGQPDLGRQLRGPGLRQVQRRGLGRRVPGAGLRNPNYGNVNARYAPRSVQFGARLSF